MGPLLFLLYINDLPAVSKLFNMIMYADDTTLYCNINEATTEFVINTEPEKICGWLASNKLSLNAKKTKFMVFHTPQRKIQYPKLLINAFEIERVTQFNFLGVIISSSLNGIIILNTFLYPVIYVYPQAILFTLYDTLIVPHFSYCLLVWGAKLMMDHPIHMLQKKALRIISNRGYVAHSEPICKEFHLRKVPDMFRFSIWKCYYKLMNKQLPLYFENMKPELPIVCKTHNIRYGNKWYFLI